MAIDGDGLPVHADATLTIKPRLLLEGNAYIDLRPGSPAAPDLRSGALVPRSQTAVSVQADQVLDVFDLPTRQMLQSSIGALATGLGGHPPRAPGWAALRTAVRAFDSALPPVTTVAHAAQGTEPGDLTRAIGSSSDVTAQLATEPAALADIVSSYNRTFGALASENTALAGTVSGFDAVLRAAPLPLRELDAALPTLTSFANELRPALHTAPGSLAQANALLDQIALVSRPSELPKLLARLGPALAELPGLESRLRTLFGYTNPVTSCIATHVIPQLEKDVPDGVNSTGDPAYLDLVHAFAGLTGFSSAVDGNGGTVRLGITTGDRIVDTIFPGLGQLVARLPNVDGLRPTWLGFGVDPPFRPDQPCSSQPLPSLSESAGALPDWASGAAVAHPVAPRSGG
jgi:ABC-type transporter Mla subunit MlaD